jgi:hypothetical protein
MNWTVMEAHLDSTLIPALPVKVRVEDTHFRDPIHRQFTPPCGLPDRFWGGRFTDAKGLLFVFADIRVDPGHLILRIIVHDRAADLCPSLIYG